MLQHTGNTSINSNNSHLCTQNTVTEYISNTIQEKALSPHPLSFIRVVQSFRVLLSY